MTLQELRGKMYEKGLMKQSVESKAVTIAYGIMSECETTAADIAENEAQLRRTKTDISDCERQLSYKRWNLERQEEDLTKYRQNLDNKKQEIEGYISEFYEKLNQCETPEARDAMRIAQMYINSVDVETKYDNTAFIVGLAAILTGKTMEPVEELKKINKSLPDPPRHRY